MKVLGAFLVIRLLDLWSTYLCMSKYGGWSDVEAAPMSAFLVKHLSYPAFSIINVAVSFTLAYLLLKTKYRIAISVFLGINSLVIASNFTIFLLI